MAEKATNLFPQITYKGTFKDIAHFKIVSKNILKELSRTRAKTEGQSLSFDFFYNKITVSFSTKIKEEEIELNPYESKILIKAPKRKGELNSKLNIRRLQYLGELLKYMDAMKTLSIAQIYAVIQDEGKIKLSNSRK